MFEIEAPPTEIATDESNGSRSAQPQSASTVYDSDDEFFAGPSNNDGSSAVAGQSYLRLTDAGAAAPASVYSGTANTSTTTTASAAGAGAGAHSGAAHFQQATDLTTALVESMLASVAVADPTAVTAVLGQLTDYVRGLHPRDVFVPDSPITGSTSASDGSRMNSAAGGSAELATARRALVSILTATTRTGEGVETNSRIERQALKLLLELAVLSGSLGEILRLVHYLECPTEPSLSGSGGSASATERGGTTVTTTKAPAVNPSYALDLLQSGHPAPVLGNLSVHAKRDSWSLAESVDPRKVDRPKGTAVASDGTHVYVHSSRGLAKLGSGLHGTTAGEVVATVPEFYPGPVSSLSLGVVDGTLLFRSPDASNAGYVFVVVSCASLEVVQAVPREALAGPAHPGWTLEQDDQPSPIVVSADGCVGLVNRRELPLPPPSLGGVGDDYDEDAPTTRLAFTVDFFTPTDTDADGLYSSFE